MVIIIICIVQVAVLMSRQAMRHPHALTKKPLTLQEVLSAPLVAPVTSRLECARRADGAAAIIVASTRFMRENGLHHVPAPVIVSGGQSL